MDCPAAIVGSLDAWLPSCETDASPAARPQQLNQAVSCFAAGNHPGAASASAAAAPLPIPHPRTANAARAVDADDDGDADDEAPPLDMDFLNCMARKQHCFLSQAMASRRGAPAGSGAADGGAPGSASCCGTDSSGVSDGRSSMWASSSGASSAVAQSMGWSGSSSGASAFSGSGSSAFSGSAAANAFGSYSKTEKACPGAAPTATAAGGSRSISGGPPSSCISEGTVRRGRPRLTISSACSLPVPSQPGAAHTQQLPSPSSLCKALSSPACAHSLAASCSQQRQLQQPTALPQQPSFGRILPPLPLSPCAAHHDIDAVDCIAVKSSSSYGHSSHGHSHSQSHAASETAAAAAAFALSMISLPDNSDSEGYESCSDREGAPHSRDDTSDDINLSVSCGGSSTAAAAELEALEEHAAEAARRVLQPQLAAMRQGWLQSITSACGVIAAAGAAGSSSLSSAPPQPQAQQPWLSATAAPAVHAAAAMGLTPVSTRRGLFEGTVSAGSPRNSWQWHSSAAAPRAAGTQ
ncbi:hypothetical protein HXX76_000998 [Chlamydomonas incerta]|uniref:Uncharacterized protein n=1 Tax=Chlamydomonas incerta TaxID=51695 RepID=A0A835WBD2_CHLIN|nr:hypothetical protein HXX76_000998 [Chlamydomonas incerta]|eukprot:KAG2444241.1 hypothetical protein HXX76_000998 [Chlamydomonas incerta]